MLHLWLIVSIILAAIGIYLSLTAAPKEKYIFWVYLGATLSAGIFIAWLNHPWWMIQSVIWLISVIFILSSYTINPISKYKLRKTILLVAGILGFALFAILGFGLISLAKSEIVEPPATEVAIDMNAARTEIAATVLAQYPTQTPQSAQPTFAFTPTLVPTESIPPTVVPTEIPAIPTETAAADSNTDPYIGCPTESLGIHPDSKQPLIFKKDPYPGVLCEYEVFFLDRDYFIDIVDGVQANLIADWLHGKRYDPVTGKLIDACPTGSHCEGTWLMIGDGTVSAGSVWHVYVYADANLARARFLGSPNVKTAERQGSFACEYIVYSNSINGEGTHNNDSIRVPAGIDAQTGTVAGHTGCVGYEGEPKEAGAVEANVLACDPPTENNWVWREGTFWHYVGEAISFQVPSQILKVVYEDSSNSNDDLTANNGQQVKDAVAAKAYCE